MRIHAGDLASLLEVDLQLAGWNGALSSYPGQSSQQTAMMMLRRSFLKKFIASENPSKEANAAALALFTKVNEACREYRPCTASLPSWSRTAIGEAKAFLYDFFYPSDQSRDPKGPWGDHETEILTLSSIAQGFNVGPGSSIGSPETDFYSKFALSNLSASKPILHDLFMQATGRNPTWASMESLRRGRMGCTVAESSRLSFVSKYTEISRTICTEPVLNMMFQKGIANVLERRLLEVFNIDLSLQPDRNRRLARVGSLTGNFGTIDLTSASDSMSLALVEEFFPKSVKNWLELTSTRSTILPGGRKLELHMISSMGNAFTFPLQTIFFCSLVYGAYRALGIPIKRPGKHTDGNFAVFGDDIIVTKEAYNLVCELLASSGFSVNVDKSFNQGDFRESCGRDYHLGHDVRGVYIKRLYSVGDFYSAINRLNRWSAIHNVSLSYCVGYLRSKVRYLPIPFDEDDSHGIKVPLRLLNGQVFKDKNTGGIIYRYLTTRPRSYSVTTDLNEFKDAKGWKPKGFYVNPSALLLALLAGSIRDGRIGLRVHTDRKTVIKRSYSSRWNYIPSGLEVTPGFVGRWKLAVEFNV